MSYPLMFDAKGKKAVVIGGGRVASRKIASLLESGAELTVISPEAEEVIIDLHRAGRLTWLQKTFEPGDLAGAKLIIAAANDASVNEKVAETAADHQLVNVADEPGLGNFHTPSVLRRGKLTMAVSTGGASPALARNIRDDLAEMYDESFEDYLEFLFQFRERIKRTTLEREEKQRLLRKLLHPEYKERSKQQEVLASFQSFLIDHENERMEGRDANGG